MSKHVPTRHNYLRSRTTLQKATVFILSGLESITARWAYHSLWGRRVQPVVIDKRSGRTYSGVHNHCDHRRSQMTVFNERTDRTIGYIAISDIPDELDHLSPKNERRLGRLPTMGVDDSRSRNNG